MGLKKAARRTFRRGNSRMSRRIQDWGGTQGFLAPQVLAPNTPGTLLCVQHNSGEVRVVTHADARISPALDLVQPPATVVGFGARLVVGVGQLSFAFITPNVEGINPQTLTPFDGFNYAPPTPLAMGFTRVLLDTIVTPNGGGVDVDFSQNPDTGLLQPGDTVYAVLFGLIGYDTVGAVPVQYRSCGNLTMLGRTFAPSSNLRTRS